MEDSVFSGLLCLFGKLSSGELCREETEKLLLIRAKSDKDDFDGLVLL